MKNLRMFVVGASLLWTGPAWAQAQDETLFGRAADDYGPKINSTTFTLFGGVYFHGRDQYLPDADDIASEIWNMGLRLGWVFHPMIEAEASFSYTPTQTLSSDQDVYLYAVNAVGQYPVHKQVVPYLTLGLGGVTYDQKIPSVGSTKFALNYGAGLKIFMFKDLALCPDFRAVTSFGDTQTSLLASLNLQYYIRFNPEPPPDRDKDGIYDSVDQCPDQAETLNTFQDEDGCPDVLPVAEPALAPDKDGDGIADDKDRCPSEPETINQFQDEDGCPDVKPDKDGDGIPDAVDQCPNEPETINGFRDEDGCPDSEIQSFEGVIEGVQFATGSSGLAPSSSAVLDRAVEVLKKYPELTARVEGYTDSTGPESLNQGLSQQRAESVKAYLVEKGVRAGRLETVGRGSAQPVADNSTSEGRAKNRRIEFRLNKE